MFNSYSNMLTLPILLFLFVMCNIKGSSAGFENKAHPFYMDLTESSSLNLSREKNQVSTDQQGNKINVKDHGIKGDGISDDTKALQKLIDNQEFGHLYFPKGIYILSGITLKSGLTLEGESAEMSILKTSTHPDDSLIRGDDLDHVTIEKLSILNDQKTKVVLILFAGESRQMDMIKIANCKISNKLSPADCIVFSKLMKNIFVLDNTIEAMQNPPIRREHTQISCLRLRGEHTFSDRKSPIHITGNTMTNGNCGFRISGKGNPPAPIYFDNNTVSGQIGSGALFYHSTNCFVRGNTFRQITSISMNNNDGGVVWLDKYREGKTIFRKNTIENCIGNGIYVEELRGSIIDSNIIRNLKKRKADTYKAKFKEVEYTSNGGHGILLTGGARDLMIRNNVISNNEGSGIHMDRGIGVQQKAKIDSIDIVDNEIDMNENGVLIMGKVEKVKIIHNKFKNNGNSSDGSNAGAKHNNSAAVKVERKDQNDHLRELTFSENTVDGNESGNKQYNAISKTYSDVESRVILNDNYINTSGGEAVSWPLGKKTVGKNTFKKNGKSSID